MIADFEFYVETYMGNSIPEDDFPRCATRADAYLNEITVGRYALDSLSDSIKEAVKMAECAIAEQVFAAESAVSGTGAAVSSESVGDHSVHYLSREELNRQLGSDAKRAAQRYLLTTGLLFRGVPVCTHLM